MAEAATGEASAAPVVAVAEEAPAAEAAPSLFDDDANYEGSDRNLAYVQTIQNISPIPKADMIEVVTVLGWNVVVKKGLYKVGDPVVYCEIDSVLPPWDYFINDKLDKVHFRIKTIKLRGQISQGYCIPLHVLSQHPSRRLTLLPPADFSSSPSSSSSSAPSPAAPPPASPAVSAPPPPASTKAEADPTSPPPPSSSSPLVSATEGKLIAQLRDEDTGVLTDLCVGTNLTELIGIKKHEVKCGIWVSTGTSRPRGNFPSFLVKTDQVRIQNLPSYPHNYPDVQFEVTEKLEGTSITAYFYRGRFGICSRNIDLDIDDTENMAVRTLLRLQIHSILTTNQKHIALQGELIGPKIQNNIYKLEDYDWRIFDVYLINESRYASCAERRAILAELGLGHPDSSCPYLGVQTLAGQTVQSILTYAEGISALRKGVQREGVVFKSMELVDGRPLHFKAVSNVYELKRD